MNEKLLTPIFGFILGFISWESFESVLCSLAIAFAGGVVAWTAKKLCDSTFNWYKLKRKKKNEKTSR